MITERSLNRWFSWPCLGALLVAGFLCLPIFAGLGNADLGNDEAIYSYSVDRILETGDWLVPRAIPFDGPFLEKPPLKAWLVAGLIETGIVGHDERGLRTVDAVFGAVAFLYVYGLGCLLAGPLCGAVAVFVLFLFEPLLLSHGLRTNNMEAPLFLAYCGGMYHFARWAEERPGGWRPSGHALAVGAYIVLGFMTKFVAVCFLPLVCALALLWRADGRWRTAWRAWTGPLLLVVVLTVPWFIYAWDVFGPLLWHVMLGQHVYTRFTASLDPSHVHPWTFYFAELWYVFAHVHTVWLVVPGLVLLVVAARRGRPWLARLVLLWFAVPVVLISFGTSKLFHYVYPFVPPLALAAGLAAHEAIEAIGPAIRAAAARLPGIGRLDTNVIVGPRPRARQALIVAALIPLALAVWTMAVGPVAFDAGAFYFSNESIVRPMLIGSILLGLGTAPRAPLHAWVLFPLLVIAVGPGYQRAVEMLSRPNHPLRSIRDCAVAVQQSDVAAGRGVYNAARALAGHPYYYYLRPLGPWKFADRPVAADIDERLVERGQPTLVSRDDLGLVAGAVASGPAGGDVTRASHRQPPNMRIAGVVGGAGVVVLLPGPYSACVAPAVAAGWRAVGETVVNGTGP